MVSTVLELYQLFRGLYLPTPPISLKAVMLPAWVAMSCASQEFRNCLQLALSYFEGIVFLWVLSVCYILEDIDENAL